MKPVFKTVLLAGLLASITALSQAQPAAGQDPGPASDVRPHLQERMQERIHQREADLKAKLKLTPEQDGAWAAFATAMKPPATIRRPDRAAMDRLSTPERLDKMRELRKQRDAEMDKREDATRTFYATLNPEQKKIFDANTARPFHNRGPQGRRQE